MSRVCMYACMYVCALTLDRPQAQVCVTCMYICMYVCMYVCASTLDGSTCTCMHVYSYICTCLIFAQTPHTYTHTHTYGQFLGSDATIAGAGFSQAILYTYTHTYIHTHIHGQSLGSDATIAGAGFFQAISTRAAGLQVIDLRILNSVCMYMYVCMRVYQYASCYVTGH